MNYRRFLLASFFLVFIAFFPASAQLRDSVDLNTIIAKSVKYTNDYPIEKVYIHFDKPYYAVGDTMWMKAYVTVDEHVPSTMSKIVYVDIYNDQDSLMTAVKLPVTNGIAIGQIPLSVESYKQGNYRLRGYTTWMLNFDAAYLFNKIITIGNPVNNDVLTQISFSESKGAQPTISTRIQYKDADGKPYANSRVSWTVESGHEDVTKGKGTTDASGYLSINLPPIPSITLSSAVMITIINMPDKKKDVTRTFSLKQAAPGKDVQFFPEGGSLIAGIQSKVAVKAIRSDGLGIDVKGTITDNTGTEVTKFESQHLGMGVFNLQPEAGKAYKANVSFSDGTQISYNLPRVQPSGIVLSVDNNSNPDSLSITMTVNDAYLTANQGKRIYLIAQCGGFIKYAAQTALQKKVYLATIPKTKFPTGILQISILSASGSPISERLAFVQSNDLMSLNMNTDKPLYGRRQPVKMNITAKDGTAPALANLSVAVIDENKIPVDEDAESTILTSLLLTSDLKGYIEKPNYYFRNKDPKTLADLDALMLTQGYRRFSYRDIVNDKKPTIAVMPEQGINISGTLRNNTGMPVFKGNVRLLMSDRNTALDAVTNADGIFTFPNVMVNDSVKVTVNARSNANPNNLVLSVDGSKYPAPTRISALPDEKLNIDSAMRPYLANTKTIYNSTHQLKEVEIKATTVPKRLGHLDQPALSGLGLDPDHVIDGDRFKGCTNFVSCLQSMAMGLIYDGGLFYVQRDYNQGNRYPVAVFIDGMKMDNTMLQTINAADVESVEIFFKDGLTGINQMDETNGVLIINKKKAPKGAGATLADLQKLIPPPYIIEFNPKGYAIAREFYSPKYVVNKLSTTGPDLRTTIYWNPKVITDKTTGAASVQFFNADGAGSYRAVVEGIDNNGHVGRFVYRYKVQ
jgi:hypothetical protein